MRPPPADLSFRHQLPRNPAQPKPTGHMVERFGLIPVRSPLLGESRLLSFPEGTEMFHFPSLSSLGYLLFRAMGGMNLHGLPHSEIPGSMPVSGSPRLIAAIHVLHRLSTPRHPSHALTSLTITVSSFEAPARWINHPAHEYGQSSRQEPALSCCIPTTRSVTRTLRLLSSRFSKSRQKFPRTPDDMELIGLEPTTSSLQSWRSPS